MKQNMILQDETVTTLLDKDDLKNYKVIILHRWHNYLLPVNYTSPIPVAARSKT
jgi:hypothetical protein